MQDVIYPKIPNLTHKKIAISNKNSNNSTTSSPISLLFRSSFFSVILVWYELKNNTEYYGAFQVHFFFHFKKNFICCKKCNSNYTFSLLLLLTVERRCSESKAKQLGDYFCVMLCFKQIVFNVKHFIAFKNKRNREFSKWHEQCTCSVIFFGCKVLWIIEEMYLAMLLNGSCWNFGRKGEKFERINLWALIFDYFWDSENFWMLSRSWMKQTNF